MKTIKKLITDDAKASEKALKAGGFGVSLGYVNSNGQKAIMGYVSTDKQDYHVFKTQGRPASVRKHNL